MTYRDRDGEVELSPFGLGWWTADQLARLGWHVSLLATVAAVWQVWVGNRWCVVAVAIGGAGLMFAWLVEVLVIPLARRGRRG
jgi:hypothetical protein